MIGLEAVVWARESNASALKSLAISGCRCMNGNALVQGTPIQVHVSAAPVSAAQSKVCSPVTLAHLAATDAWPWESTHEWPANLNPRDLQGAAK